MLVLCSTLLRNHSYVNVPLFIFSTLFKILFMMSVHQNTPLVPLRIFEFFFSFSALTYFIISSSFPGEF